MTSSITVRGVADSIRNAIDYLWEAELLLNYTSLSETTTRVSWHPINPRFAFLDSREHTTIGQYRNWITGGNYTCVLFDGALLQISYTIERGQVSGHRLAYIPCPWDIDSSLIEEGIPLDEILEFYDSDAISMKSPVRFDFDPKAGRPGHPVSHMTFNSVDCRIACIAPLHAHRFTNFVFQHFYADIWSAHREFFAVAPFRHLGEPVILAEERDDMHIGWNPRLQLSA